MTWRALMAKLTEDELDTDVTIYDENSDEIFRIAKKLQHTDIYDDILDANHPYLVLER
jgi:hypothetical protein